MPLKLICDNPIKDVYFHELQGDFLTRDDFEVAPFEEQNTWLSTPRVAHGVELKMLPERWEEIAAIIKEMDDRTGGGVDWGGEVTKFQDKRLRDYGVLPSRIGMALFDNAYPDTKSPSIRVLMERQITLPKGLSEVEKEKRLQSLCVELAKDWGEQGEDRIQAAVDGVNAYLRGMVDSLNERYAHSIDRNIRLDRVDESVCRRGLSEEDNARLDDTQNKVAELEAEIQRLQEEVELQRSGERQLRAKGALQHFGQNEAKTEALPKAVRTAYDKEQRRTAALRSEESLAPGH